MWWRQDEQASYVREGGSTASVCTFYQTVKKNLLTKPHILIFSTEELWLEPWIEGGKNVTFFAKESYSLSFQEITVLHTH